MKAFLIIGLVGLLWELLPSHGGELISIVLFSLLATAAIARRLRPRDIAVICGVGLLWETAAGRDAVTIALFGFPLFRLLWDRLAAHQTRARGAARRLSSSPFSPRRVREYVLDGLVRWRVRVKTRAFMLESVASAGMLALGVGAAIILTASLGVSREILGYGALSYALGVVGFKGLLYADLVVPILHGRVSTAWLATAQGVVSALSELGAAALFFWLVLPRLSVADLIGFGAAAGIVEALVIPLMSIGGFNVLDGTPVEEHAAEPWQNLGATPLAVMVFPVVERGLTMVLHTSSRALIYAAMVLNDVVPALLAVALFASVDGLAYYALLDKWRFLSFAVAIRFYALMATAAGILSLVFWRLQDSL